MALDEIYLDACCVMRLGDDPSQRRIRFEIEAIKSIITLIEQGAIVRHGSPALIAEIESGPATEYRKLALELCERYSVPGEFGLETKLRARELYGRGFSELDAIHLACAERSGSTALLTTDDGFLKKAVQWKNKVKIKVAGPLDWLLAHMSR